jgi:hypothetical protein
MLTFSEYVMASNDQKYSPHDSSMGNYSSIYNHKPRPPAVIVVPSQQPTYQRPPPAIIIPFQQGNQGNPWIIIPPQQQLPSRPPTIYHHGRPPWYHHKPSHHGSYSIDDNHMVYPSHKPTINHNYRPPAVIVTPNRPQTKPMPGMFEHHHGFSYEDD